MSVNFQVLSISKNRSINSSNKRNQVMIIFKGVKYGAFAGFIASWSISSVIAVTELLLGLSIGTFYSIMGISLGVNGITVLTLQLLVFTFWSELQ